MIWRHLLNNIKIALKEFPVVILTGARQVGKSTLVQLLINEWPAKYVTLDDRLALDTVLLDPDDFLEANPRPLVVDEAQKAPDLFRAIKKQVDLYRRPGQFLLTGSANLMRLPQIGETLAGRAAIFELYPFSWAELSNVPPSNVLGQAFQLGEASLLVESLPKRAPDRKDEIRKKIIAGFYPIPALAVDARIRAQWYKSYRQTYVERDVRDLTSIEHIVDFNRLYMLLASRTGKLLNKADLARDSGLPYATLHRYLNILETTYQNFFLRPYYINVSKRLMKTPKSYFTDTGMAAHLLAIDHFSTAESKGLAGQLIETWVANELVKLLSVANPEMQLFYWREATGSEVDFLVTKGLEVVGIEVKWSSTLTSRDFTALRKLAKFLPQAFRLGIVLYAGTEVMVVDSRTIAMPFSVFFGIDS